MMRRPHWLLALLVLAAPIFVSAQGAPASQTPPPAAPRAGAPATTATRAPRTPAPPLQLSTDLTGWTSMFDGVSLKGWDGPMPLWHVEDGAIVVQSVADPPTGSVYLIWQGGQPKDFEMKFDVKLQGDGANSGLQFRAALLGEVPGRPMTKWESHGYQADMTNMGGAGNLIECCRGPNRGLPVRPDAHASRGQVTRSATTEGGSAQLLATVEDPVALRGDWKSNDWNSIWVIARGRTMMYICNGHLMSVLIDDSPTMFQDHGYVAIQLEGPGANKAWFKNLWIKQLPS